MQTPRTALSLAALLVVFGLAACSDPQPAGMTAAETQQSLSAIQGQATTVLDDPGMAHLAGILDGIDTSSLLVLGTQLPRGIYEYDSATDTWTLLGPSGDLELRWLTEPAGEDATMLIDWDATAPTVVRDLANGDVVELPQGSSAQVSLDGTVVADFDQTATWPVNECGYLTEPGTFYVSGTAGDADVTLSVDETGVSVTSSGDQLSAQSQGGLELTSAAGRAWLDWTAGLDLSVTRDETTCEITDGEVESGHVSVDLGVETDADTESVGFATNFDVIPPQAPGESPALGLSGGRLTLNGRLAVTWAGVLDDSNGNGVPGENLTLTFADGSMSLEEFLRDHFAGLFAGMRLAGALR